MMERNENKPPPWSPPPNYVTLDMLRERYLKAQEQKRIDMEKEERERGGGDPEKEAAEEVNIAVENNCGSKKEMDEREKEAAEVVPKMPSEIGSTAASSHPHVRTNRRNQWNSRKERGNQKRREKEEMPSKIDMATPSDRAETSSRRQSEMQDRENGNKREKESLPLNYVTLVMLRERYLKAQEQKRIDSEKEERDRTEGNPEKKAVKEVIEEREKDVPKMSIENSSAAASSHQPVKTSCWNQRKCRKERENRKRKEEKVKEITETPCKIAMELETVDGENGNKRENEESGEYSGKIKRKKKYQKKKKKAKADETLGRSAEKVQREAVGVNGVVWVKKKVPVVANPMADIEEKFGDMSVKLCDPTPIGQKRDNVLMGYEKRGETRDVKKNVEGDPTAENGLEIRVLSRSNRKVGGARHWVAENRHKITDISKDDSELDITTDIGKNVEDDPTAENGLKIGDFSRSHRKRDGARDRLVGNWQKVTDIKKNLEGDPMAENGRRDWVLSNGDKRGRNGRRNARGGSLKRDYGNNGRVNRGKMQIDSSLVWVRKEDKGDASVTGNCLQDLLEK